MRACAGRLLHWPSNAVFLRLGAHGPKRPLRSDARKATLADSVQRIPAQALVRSLLALSLGLLAAGCDDPFMIHQPKLPAFRDARVGPGPVPAGTVEWRSRPGQATGPDLAPPLTLALIERGQERFRSFCTPCHSELGDGDGMVVRRGFSPPPSYHSARLRQAPTRHFYDVITHGFGAMYGYGDRVAPDDRWAIAAYIRALQRSTAGRLDELPAQERASLQQASR